MIRQFSLQLVPAPMEAPQRALAKKSTRSGLGRVIRRICYQRVTRIFPLDVCAARVLTTIDPCVFGSTADRQYPDKEDAIVNRRVRVLLSKTTRLP